MLLTGALAVSMVLALLHLDPIQLMFGANVLQGILAPVLVIFLLLVGNNRRKQRLSKVTNSCLVLTALLMFAAAALLFLGLLTGQSG